MKVRITYGQGSFWYENKVGEVFEVEDKLSYGDYRVKGEERNICIEHCEVVKDEDDYIGPSISSTRLMLNN
ncbi:hypothetical protein [Cohnella zeiphila]|uniref:Uncharacterized protein n=1 Tax=Cohnella zeiphila TaxID=2761120 RepID=A0A7X0SKW7_9BACL|nr:hypothetical protein [Cohnella zeiphila]MBB6731900.1 hypothetical protein [Cohnella zeiphila]